MFRMIVYLYDVKYQSGPVQWKDYLSYFFLLPNYYFLLFPVVDHQTFRKAFSGATSTQLRNRASGGSFAVPPTFCSIG